MPKLLRCLLRDEIIMALMKVVWPNKVKSPPESFESEDSSEKKTVEESALKIDC
jgi:hypothetical protein